VKLNGIGVALMHPDSECLYPSGQMREAERVARDCYAPRKWLDRPPKPEPPPSKEDSEMLSNALSRVTTAQTPRAQALAMFRYWRKEAAVANTPRMIAAAESAVARWEQKIKELEDEE
jgi:hypothetical protein